jgi:hypothetical protein
MLWLLAASPLSTKAIPSGINLAPTKDLRSPATATLGLAGHSLSGTIQLSPEYDGPPDIANELPCV